MASSGAVSAGLPSAAEATEWVVGQLEQTGIEDIEVQQLQQEEGAALWLPLRWKMALVANSEAGPGSSDVVLESAMPLPRSELPEGGLTAPLVYLGTGSAAESMHADVEGKVVLRRVSPQAHSFFESQATFESARQLFGRGAAAVVNMMDMPGNARSFDYFGCGDACFNLGGQDSRFLRAVLNRAAETGTADALRMRLTLETESLSGLTAQNALAVIPGASDEAILIVSHVDSWFDGANDNADGLAVTLALARHFAALDRQLERTLIFLISVGHHTAGLNGPIHFVRMNPDIIDKTVLAINVEHVAARNLAPARTFFSDGHREFDADTGEAPISAGITNESPYLLSLIDEGVARYGTNFVSGNSTASSGESQWLINLGFPRADHHAGLSALSHLRGGGGDHLDARHGTHGALSGFLHRRSERRVDGGAGQLNKPGCRRLIAGNAAWRTRQLGPVNATRDGACVRRVRQNEVVAVRHDDRGQGLRVHRLILGNDPVQV